MRATTVTLGLGVTALVAVALAPRLIGSVDRAEVVVVPVPVVSVPVVVAQLDAEPVPTPVVERSTVPAPIEPTVAESLVIHGGRGSKPGSLIPELDARPNHRTPPVRRHVRVEPPAEPIEPIGWDCPACGMG